MKNTTNSNGFTSTVEVIPNSNKTNAPIEAGNANTMAKKSISSTLNTSTLPHYAVCAVRSHYEDMAEILMRFSAIDYLTQLQKMDFDYKQVLHDIDSGCRIEREPNENPAEVLAVLRECYRITPKEEADRANLLRCMGDLLQAVDSFVRQLKNCAEMKE